MKMKNLVLLVAMVIITSLSMAKEITVSAAVSLKDVMQDIKKAYEADAKEEKVIFNFGGSGSLQQQVENGAPVDVFISAAPKQIDELIKKEFIEKETKVDLVKNDVVLVIPKNSKLNIYNYNGLTDISIQKIGIGEPKSVPCGQYAMEIFKSLGIADKLTPKLIFGKDVREILRWVETENADAGIVYKTDAIISDKVKIVCVAPKGSHSVVIYPAAIIKDSKVKESAKSFVDYLKGAKAKALFEKYGFTPLN